jgi:hypothetical protein
VLRFQQKRAGSDPPSLGSFGAAGIGAPLSANGQPQFWRAEHLHMVVAWGGHFRGLTARFFFSTLFWSCAFLDKKAAKPL